MRKLIICGILLSGLMACSKGPEGGSPDTDGAAKDPSKYTAELSFLTEACVANGNSEESCNCATEQVARYTPEPALKTYIAMGASEDPDAFVETEMSETEANQLADAFIAAAQACDLISE